MDGINYGYLLGGLGIFLFGMLVFEETIASMGKGYLKKFLEKNTNTRFKSIVAGILQTAIFQSSTIVTMLTLGFVGAGIIGLSNALGVIIGANIGTTLTPWLITLFGFKFDIDALALPMIGVGGLLAIFFSSSEKMSKIAKFIIGLGLLFLGLEYMKDGVASLTGAISLEQFSHFSVWGYVLIGAIITSIMQTSTGVIIIILTALNAGLITLDMALGLLIGANFGSAISTTIMGLLGSTSQQTAKKKVAFSHFIFNISATVIVTLLYPYIKIFLLWLLGGHGSDNLFILSAFHTTFNIVLAVLWTPLLGRLLQVLNKIFPTKKSALELAIHAVNTEFPEEMMAALEKDVRKMLAKTEAYNRRVLYLGYHNAHEIQKDYIELKEMEGHLLSYVVKLNKGILTEQQANKMRNLNDTIMHAILSSKNLKDIQHHIINLKDESLTTLIAAESLRSFQELMEKTSNHIDEIKNQGDEDSNVAVLETALEAIHATDDDLLEDFSKKAADTEIDTRLLPEILKTNRYVLLSCEELLKAYIDFLRKE